MPSTSKELDQERRSASSFEDAQTLSLAALNPQRQTRQFHTGLQIRLWQPEAFHFDIDKIVDIDEFEFEKYATIPTVVPTGPAIEGGQPKSAMQSEISVTAGNAGLVGAGNVISIFLKYFSTFLIQYGFGPGLYGLYTLSSSLVNLISSIFNLGLDDAMVRYTAVYRSRKSSSTLKGLTIFCTALAGIAGLIGALLLVFFTPPLATFWASLRSHNAANINHTLKNTIPLLQIMAPMIPLLCMQAIWFGGLRGFKDFKKRVLAMSVLQPLLQIILLIFVLRYFYNIASVALVMLISTTVTAILNFYFLFRRVAKVATPEPQHYESREWLTFASFNFLTTVIDTVLDSIDTILLAAFGLPDIQLGEYGAALRLSMFISMPLLTLNSTFAPTIAELYAKGEKQKLEAMFKVVTKWSITFSLPIFLVIALFARYLLGVSGAGFIAAWPLVIAFAAGPMVNAGTGSVGYMLLMTGYQKLSFLNSIAAVITNVVLGVILTPRYGAMGTALSTGMALVVLNLMRVIQVRLLLKMHPYRWDVLKPIGAGLISSALIGVALYMLGHTRTSFTVGHAILSLQLLLIPVFLAMYIGLLILFKGSPEDEIVMKALRKKLMRGKQKNTKNLQEVG